MGDTTPTPSSDVVAYRLGELEKKIDQLGGKVVSTEVFRLVVDGLSGRITAVEQDNAELKTAAKSADDLRKAQRFTITLAVVGVVLSFVSNFVSKVLFP